MHGRARLPAMQSSQTSSVVAPCTALSPLRFAQSGSLSLCSLALTYSLALVARARPRRMMVIHIDQKG